MKMGCWEKNIGRFGGEYYFYCITIKMKQPYKIVLHTCYWLYSLDLLYMLRSSVFEHKTIDWGELFNLLTGSYLFVSLIVFYTNYFLVLPLYFKTKRFSRLWVAWVLVLAFGILLRYTLEEVLFLELFGRHNYAFSTTVSYYIFDNFYFIGIHIVISTIFWTVDYWIKTEQEKNLLQKEKFEAEISMLRNQVNPHFLFNTLNNIYSLTYKKSDKAPESILRLSELMRYMLTESNTDKVLLIQELDYIRNFIALQRLRYTNPDIVTLSIKTDNDNYKIAPLLLIPFIENGFKHGDVTNKIIPLQVTITAVNNKLLLKVTNAKSTDNKDENNGIGLQNVKRRLDLLYPSGYTLDIKDTAEEYSCHLTINL